MATLCPERLERLCLSLALTRSTTPPSTPSPPRPSSQNTSAFSSLPSDCRHLGASFLYYFPPPSNIREGYENIREEISFVIILFVFSRFKTVNRVKLFACLCFRCCLFEMQGLESLRLFLVQKPWDVWYSWEVLCHHTCSHSDKIRIPWCTGVIHLRAAILPCQWPTLGRGSIGLGETQVLP